MKNFFLKITVLLGCLWLASIPSLADQFTHKGFYIGLGVNFDDISLHHKEKGCGSSDCVESENAGLKTLLSPRIGYQFDEGRLEYMWMSFDYRYQSKPFDMDWHLINMTYNIFHGINFGGGFGYATGVHGGLALRLQAGYTHRLSQHFNGSINYATYSAGPFSRFFSYSSSTYIHGNGIEIVISYHF